MATSTQTTTPAAKTTGNSSSAASTAKKPRRVAAGKAIRIDTDVLAKIDERAQQMTEKFGFKPNASQVIGFLLRTQQAIDDAKAIATTQAQRVAG